jgi:hypothetical protein
VVKELNHGDVANQEHSDEFKQKDAEKDHIDNSEFESSKP